MKTGLPKQQVETRSPRSDDTQQDIDEEEQNVLVSPPQTFNGMPVEDIDLQAPPIEGETDSARLDALEDKIDELIRRQKKIQNIIKKILKTVGGEDGGNV